MLVLCPTQIDLSPELAAAGKGCTVKLRLVVVVPQALVAEICTVYVPGELYVTLPGFAELELDGEPPVKSQL
jgi:hypothetical protein